MCWASDRAQVRRRMYCASNEYVITGVNTTLPFYQDLIEDPVFIKGNFDTGFLEDYNKRKSEQKKDN